jgi:hypothetical protein
VKALTSFFKRVDDWFNPIVVKELRQAVRSRFVVAALLLFLAIQLTTIGIFLMSQDRSTSDFESGRRIFSVLQAILVSTCLIFVPAYTAIRLGFERSGTNVDLLFITTIRPRSIIWGKFLAGVILTVLLYSTSMPFMTFVYLLRGIDLPSIFLALAFSFLVVLMGIQVAIFIACLPVSIAVKVLLAVLAVLQVTGFLWSALRFSFSVAMGGVGFARSARGLLSFATSTGLIYLAVIGLLNVFSVALISPASSNRTLPVRVYAVAMWLVFGGMALILGGGPRRGYDELMLWAYAMVWLFSGVLWVAVSERERPSLRVARTIPRNLLLRSLAFLFYTGPAGGIVLSLGVLSVTLACVFLWPTGASGYYGSQAQLEMMSGVGLYAYCYAISAVLVRRWFFRNGIRPSQTWALALGLLAFMAVFPMVVAYIASPYRFLDTLDKLGLWTAANPFLLGESETRGNHLMFAGVWAILVTGLAYPWLSKQVREFFRYGKPRIEAGGATADSG